MKKLAQFVIMTITSAVTIFAFFIMFFRTDLIIELLSSKPVLLLMGLVVGSTVGFLVGVLITYHKFNTKLEKTEAKLEEKEEQLEETREQLQEATVIIKQLVSRICKFKQRKANNTANKNNARRKDELFSEIDDLSDDQTVIEDDITDDEETSETQDEVPDET